MAINFPSTTGQATDGSFTHVVGYVTYKWNGVSWNASVSGGGGGGGIALTDISIVKPNPTASGSGDVTYNSTLGAFTYTPSEIFSGSYTDLTNKPTIPTALSNIVDSAQGVNVTGKVATTDGIDIDIGGGINAAGTSIDFQNTTISFSGASIGGLQSTINAGVDVHLNTSGASSGEILSWNGSDYAWVADQTGGGGAAGLSVSIPHGATDLTKTFVAADANSINGTVTSQLRIYVLPQGSTLTLGDQFYIFDIGDENLSGNAASYNISIAPHSGNRIQGAAADTPYIIASNAGSVRLIWMGSTYQWRVFQ